MSIPSRRASGLVVALSCIVVVLCLAAGCSSYEGVRNLTGNQTNSSGHGGFDEFGNPVTVTATPTAKPVHNNGSPETMVVRPDNPAALVTPPSGNGSPEENMSPQAGLVANKTPVTTVPTTRPPTTKPTKVPTTVPTTVPVPVVPAFQTYNDPTYGFSITYPSNWTKDKPSSGSGVYFRLVSPGIIKCNAKNTSCVNTTSNFAIMIQKTDEVTPEDYFTKSIAELTRTSEITTTSKNSQTSLSGFRAYWVEYFTKDSRGNRDRSVLRLYAVVGHYGYIIVYYGPYTDDGKGVYDKYMPEVLEMIRSMKIPAPVEAVDEKPP